jgi:hypothetical protein
MSVSVTAAGASSFLMPALYLFLLASTARRSSRQQSLRIDAGERIIFYVGVPVIAVGYGVLADESPGVSVVVAVAEELETGIGIRLVLLSPHETERSRRGPCPADYEPERVVEDSVGGRLAGIGDSTG